MVLYWMRWASSMGMNLEKGSGRDLHDNMTIWSRWDLFQQWRCCVLSDSIACRFHSIAHSRFNSVPIKFRLPRRCNRRLSTSDYFFLIGKLERVPFLFLQLHRFFWANLVISRLAFISSFHMQTYKERIAKKDSLCTLCGSRLYWSHPCIVKFQGRLVKQRSRKARLEPKER